jgi:hypothetical protein
VLINTNCLRVSLIYAEQPLIGEDVSALNRVCVLLLSFILLSSGAILFSSVNASETGVANTWESKGTIPISRNGFKAVAVDDRIFIFSKDATYIFNVNDGSWVQKTGMPTPRTGFAIAYFDNKIYIIGGGQAHSLDDCKANEAYNIQTNTWETKQPLLKARGSAGAFAIEGNIHVIGGGSEDGTALNQVYDIANDSWTDKTPNQSILGLTLTAQIGYKIYAISTTGTYIYDTQADSWSIGSAIPQAYPYQFIGATTGVHAPQRIYVMGGDSSPNSFNRIQAVGTNYVYDPVSDSWSTAASMLTPRIDCAVGVLNDRIYVLCGIVSGVPFDDHIDSNVVEVYTPIGYGKAPPEAKIFSPINNKTYTSNTITLEFSLNKPAKTITYTLNNRQPVKIEANTTLTGLTNGEYNLTLTLTDEKNNTATQTITFSVKVFYEQQPNPTKTNTQIQTIPTTTIAGIIVATSIIAATGILVYQL